MRGVFLCVSVSACLIFMIKKTLVVRTTFTFSHNDYETRRNAFLGAACARVPRPNAPSRGRRRGQSRAKGPPDKKRVLRVRKTGPVPAAGPP